MAGNASPNKLQGLKAVIDRSSTKAMLAGALPSLAKKLAADRGGQTPALSQSEAQSASRALAVLETIVLAASTEGEVSQPEIERLSNALVSLGDATLSHEQYSAVFVKLADLLSRDGLAVRASYLLRSLEDEESRRGALELAVGVALLDGDLGAGFDESFELLADALDIPADEAETIVGKIRKEMSPARSA